MNLRIRTLASGALALCALSLAPQVSAQYNDRPGRGNLRAFTLQMYDREFRGQDQILALKMELSRQYPRLDLRDYDLQSVQIWAKSARGQGQAELFVDGRTQDRVGVPGEQRLYNSPISRSFYSLQLNSYMRGNQQQGVWQVRFDGNIKVRQVTVTLRSDNDRRDRPGRLRYVVIASDEKVDKILAESKTFRTYQENVMEVMLEATHKTVNIQDVVVYFANGQRESLIELRGVHHDGQVVRASLRNARNVVAITVTAASPAIFGDKGRYRLSLGINDRGW